MLTVAEGEGFEPSRRCYRLRDFQSRALGQAMRPFLGGEGGIRTHGGSSPHRFSRAAPSTTRTPLQPVKYTNGVASFGAGMAKGTAKPPGSYRAACHGTPGRIRTCGLWVRNPTLYPLSYRRVSLILHQIDGDPPRRAFRGGKGGIRTLGAHFLRSTA